MAKNKASNVDAQEVLNIMKNLKVKELYKNSKGEYFTSENLAVLSEKGKKDKVEKLTEADVKASLTSEEGNKEEGNKEEGK